MLHLTPAGLAPAVLDAVQAPAPPVAVGAAVASPLDHLAMSEIVAIAVASVERNCILSVLELQKGNRQAVADLMGISAAALEAKLDGLHRK